MAFAQEPSTCHTLYAQRGMALFEAAECYLKLPQPDYEASFVALSAAVNDFKSKPEERTAIDRGLELVKTYQEKLGETPEILYWRACMKSFDAQRRDRGAMIPRSTMSVLKSIQYDLNQALKATPEIHSFGPQRVLGLIHIELPRVLGGDRVFAERNLETAWRGAPQLSANWIAYSKSLVATGKREQAKKVLEQFLLLTDADLNPYSDALRFPKVETIQDRELARQLLEQL